MKEEATGESDSNLTGFIKFNEDFSDEWIFKRKEDKMVKQIKDKVYMISQTETSRVMEL